MTIDPRGHEQEPLFPTSNEERNAMQEDLLDILDQVAKATIAMQQEAKRRRGEIAGLNKRGAKLEELLRQSRPRK